MPSLYERSVQIILQGQAPSGAYIASPNFPTYHYCWLRDGSFIAHAMDTAGEFASAEAFFRWVGRAIQKYGAKVDDVRRSLEAGSKMGKDDFLHTRFTISGDEVTVDSTWGNFQIDGYGSWLWALAEHVRLSGNPVLAADLLEPIQITLKYLELVWKLPNYDCWEEFPEYLHPYSLATVYSGFEAMARLAGDGSIDADAEKCHKLAAEVKEFILNYAVSEGRLVKQICPETAGEPPKQVLPAWADASLLGVAVPFGVLELDHPTIRATIQSIEADLHRPGGGVYRYKADVYYGGGEWPLLAAWLGWYYAKIGKADLAAALCGWIESQASTDGSLPEQVNDHVLSPESYAPWVQRWGPVASPLLWSHAMYMILANEIHPGSSDDRTR